MLKVGWKVVTRADEQADIIALDCSSVSPADTKLAGWRWGGSIIVDYSLVSPTASVCAGVPSYLNVRV